MRKLIIVAIIVSLFGALLFGCSPESKIVENKINVYTSFFPLYDMTREIGGAAVNVINLIPAGVEAHDWTPKSRELSDIRKAELLIFNGAGFEGWIEDFEKSLDGSENVKLIEASAGVDLIKVEETSTDEHVHEEEHAHEDEHGHDHGNIDPHVWLSPLQAKQLATNIYKALSEVDAPQKATYEANYNAYVAKLDKLHTNYKTQITNAKRKEIVVQHEAYAYLCRDYGLTQMPIMGISPDAEPTAQDMKKISDFVKQHDVQYIMFEELVSDKVAKTLASDLNIQTIVFSPVEGLTEEQASAGETYISMMERNLQNLVTALQ